jgi:lipoprotein-releasing system permease protein
LNLPFHIARRYLFSKKSHNAINIISMVSVCGVAIVTIALVCVLSVMNGFSSLIASLFSDFDPQLKVIPKTGKVFTPAPETIDRLKALPEVAFLSEVLQDNALVRFGDRQEVAVVKGVDPQYAAQIPIRKTLIDGEFKLREDVVDYATLGIGLAYYLGIKTGFVSPLEIYAPKRDQQVNLANPTNSFNTEYAYITGVFSINQQMYDDKYMIVSLDLARSLFNYEKEVSALEIKLQEKANPENARQKISQVLGPDYLVQNREEQQAASFKMMAVEKWMIFLILCFILIIALFNVVGSLSMLMIEKKNDVVTLRNLGADNSLIKRIFLFEGWMISGFGGLIGLAIGVTLCLVQQEFGIIKFGESANAFIIEAYPVLVQFGDVVIVLATVLSIGFLAAWFAVYRLGRRWVD